MTFLLDDIHLDRFDGIAKKPPYGVAKYGTSQPVPTFMARVVQAMRPMMRKVP
jgi:hypothetical protein